MSTNLSAPPLQTPLVEPPEKGKPPSYLITRVWEQWFRSVTARAESAAFQSIAPTELENQAASIGLTTLLALASGLYRVSYRFRVRQAATTSSSLTFSITTTDGTVTVTQSSAPYTGNVTNAPQSGSFIVRADPSVPLSYSTVYASVGATPMKYDLDVLVEVL